MSKEDKIMAPPGNLDETVRGASLADRKPAAWEPGKCCVPMWMMGCPSGFCDKPAQGPQLPLPYLRQTRGWSDRLYCFGPCCPSHGGPRDGDPIIFTDGYTSEGYQMFCAVEHGFINLQESPAGFSGDPLRAVADLRAAQAKAGTSDGQVSPGRDQS